MLSRRTAWDLSANALAGRLEAARAAGALLDLTESNPARAGLAWPAATLAAALTAGDLSRHDPDPRGAPAARLAVAAYLAGRGHDVAPERLLLTTSTSEAYGLLLKLLCDPGDEVLVPAPAYPLLELLADLEAVRLVRYPLRYDGTWSIDLAALAAAVTPRTRAVVVVSPSNPVGALLSAGELAALEGLCAERDLALLCDEVFAETATRPAASALDARGCLAFHLSGLSKVCGLPQLKLGWIAAAGPAALVAPALERLDVIADTYLSVSAPAQLALPPLLGAREIFLAPLRARLAANAAALARVADPPFSALRGEGGWSAVLQVGQRWDEEALCLSLLDRGVAVQPGFFFDFSGPGYLVLSLLPDPATFTEGLTRVTETLRAG
jgi:aspartate/methionine/tyrosine aminotransferase